MLQPQAVTPVPDRLLVPVEQVLQLQADREVLVSEVAPGQVQQQLPVVQLEMLTLLKCVSLRLRFRSSDFRMIHLIRKETSTSRSCEILRCSSRVGQWKLVPVTTYLKIF